MERRTFTGKNPIDSKSEIAVQPLQLTRLHRIKFMSPCKSLVIALALALCGKCCKSCKWMMGLCVLVPGVPVRFFSISCKAGRKAIMDATVSDLVAIPTRLISHWKRNKPTVGKLYLVRQE